MKPKFKQTETDLTLEKREEKRIGEVAEIVGLRDVLIHQYEGVDLEQLERELAAEDDIHREE